MNTQKTSTTSPRRLPTPMWWGIGCLAALIGLGLSVKLMAPRKIETQAATVLPTPQALVDFKLTSASAIVNLASLKGHYTLLYFGYTHCPDVCPATLSELAAIYSKLTAPPALYFVSVDPERDSPDILEQYAQHFNVHFHGATGPDAELMLLTHRLGALYSRDKDADGRVNVDHSGAIYLINPSGQFMAVFTPPFITERMVNDLNALVAGGVAP